MENNTGLNVHIKHIYFLFVYCHTCTKSAGVGSRGKCDAIPFPIIKLCAVNSGLFNILRLKIILHIITLPVTNILITRFKQFE